MRRWWRFCPPRLITRAVCVCGRGAARSSTSGLQISFLPVDSFRDQWQSGQRALGLLDTFDPPCSALRPAAFGLSRLSLHKRPPGNKNSLRFLLLDETAERKSQMWCLKKSKTIICLIFVWKARFRLAEQDGWVATLRPICFEFFRCKTPAAFVRTFLSRWHKLVFFSPSHLFIFSFCTTAPESLPGHFCRMLHCIVISSRLPATLPWCWGAISLKAANCVFVLCSEISKWMSEAGKGPGYILALDSLVAPWVEWHLLWVCVEHNITLHYKLYRKPPLLFRICPV